MEICTAIYHTLKGLLAEKGRSIAVGDEGGFAPDLTGNEEAIFLLGEAIEKAGYSTDRVKICLDAAASEWQTKNGLYRLPKRDKKLDGEELVSYWKSLCDRYPIASLEDGIGENDFDTFAILTAALGYKTQLVGDDLFVTNEKRLKAGFLAGAANAVLIKPNQIGTLSETIQTVKLAKSAGFKTIMSHRSGETEDVSIAHLAVGLGTGQIKTGSLSRSERIAKYNELIRIADTNSRLGLTDPF